MQAKIEIKITVIADDGALQARELSSELRPFSPPAVSIYAGACAGAVCEALARNLPMDHPQIAAALEQAKQLCTTGKGAGFTLPGAR